MKVKEDVTRVARFNLGCRKVRLFSFSRSAFRFQDRPDLLFACFVEKVGDEVDCFLLAGVEDCIDYCFLNLNEIAVPDEGERARRTSC